MELAMKTACALAAVVLAGSSVGCGDDVGGPMCPADGAAKAVMHSVLCMSAHELARRSTQELNPTQAEIDEAAALVEAGWRPLEPILTRMPAAGPWEGMLVWISGEATDPVIAAAWRAGQIRTGNTQVDAVMEEARIVRVTWAEDRFVNLGSDHAIAAGNVVQALAGVSGVALGFDDFRAHRNPYDLIDEGIDEATGERVLRFYVGWYECDVECAFIHYWRTGVAADGTARLIDEGGDEMPPDVRASWYR